MKQALNLFIFIFLFHSTVQANESNKTIGQSGMGKPIAGHSEKTPVKMFSEFGVKIDNQYTQSVRNVLEKSIFDKNQPPESMLEGQITHYQPLSLAIVSSLYSRLPERDDDLYAQVDLPPLENSDICPNPIKAFVKLSKQDNPHTFVILPGAYATWKRGSFNNQTIAILDKHFNDPNIISFAGYLSPPFLKGVCNKIPWDSVSIAKDLYSRLSIYLNEIKADPSSTGLIGFSGGGGLAAIMLSEDSHSERLFGLGGAVFSPTLHGRTILTWTLLSVPSPT